MDIWRGGRRSASFGCMSRALLLAEAEPGTREFLERHLASEGFEVLGARAEVEALELAERARPDLVLVGGLEDASGPEVCRRLRDGEPGRSWDRDVPVIVLGEARADAVDRVHAFERGCDDFVPRPFHYEELVARIHAVLRRAHPAERERLAAGPIAIDRPTRRVTIHGFPVALAAKEYELLVKLASEPGRVFTKEELLREVWGFVALGRTRTLDSHASRLRRKLAQAGAEQCVLNVWGVGYRLISAAG
jgi:DNA-binding response OmpR family regulator